MRRMGDTMAEELQGLLNRIKEEGLSKAETERQEIMARAQEEARAIVDGAKKEAEELLRRARQEARLTQEKGEASLKQASRDILIGLRKAIEAELTRTVSLEVAQVLKPDVLVGILDRLVESFVARKGEVLGLEALLAPEDQKALETLIAGRFVGRLKEGISLHPVAGLEGGIKVASRGDSLYFDFSQEALTQALSAFLNPRIARLIAQVEQE